MTRRILTDHGHDLNARCHVHGLLVSSTLNKYLGPKATRDLADPWQ